MTPAPLPPRLLLAVLLFAPAPGCVVREVGLKTGREHLSTVATANYAFRGSARLERLLDVLSGAAPATAAADVAAVTPPAEDPVQLDLTLLREVATRDGRRVLAPVEDGDVLLDGQMRPGGGDGLKLRVQVESSCHVYVILVDASARPWQLFPQADWSSVGNPLQGGRPYRLPEGNILYPLGATRGIETLFVVASATPLTALEALMAELAAADWSGCGAPAPVQHALAITRGVASSRGSVAPAVVAPSGALSDVPSRLYVGVPGEVMVVTRWFRHR